MRDRWVMLARVAAALLVAGGVAVGWRHFGAQAVRAYSVWRYPAIRTKPALGGALKDSVDAVRRAELRAHYARVKALLDDASGRGLRVGELYEKLPVAVRMIKAGQFDYARVFLASIEARIPRKRETVVPAGQEADPEEAVPSPSPSRRTPLSGKNR